MLIDKNAREVLEYDKSDQGENCRHNQSGFEPRHQGCVWVGQQAESRQKVALRVPGSPLLPHAERSDLIGPKQLTFPTQLFKQRI